MNCLHHSSKCLVLKSDTRILALSPSHSVEGGQKPGEGGEALGVFHQYMPGAAASAAAEAAAAENYRPALWTAVCHGQVNAAMVMMQHAEIDERGGMDATTPLMEAVFQDRMVLVEALIGHGAKVALVCLNGETAMHRVANVGLEAMLLLLEKGASVSDQSEDGSTPLHFAALNSNEEVVRKLVEHGAEVSAENGYGYTPLHMAVIGGNEAVVQLLVHAGAELGLTCWSSGAQTARDMATRHGKGDIAALLKTAEDAVHRAKCEAFAMGHQERLGADSRVRWLDAGVVQMVLEFL